MVSISWNAVSRETRTPVSSEWPSLGADGSITGRFVDKRTAEELGAAVEKYRANSKSDHSKYIERWVGQSVPGASTTRIEVADRNGEFVLEAKFASPRFAQRPQAQMMIFKAGLLSHGDLRLAEKKRKHPVVVETDVLRETVRIQRPAGFKGDELPTAVRIDSAFGKYEATWAAEDGAGGAICGTQAVPRSLQDRASRRSCS
jgi:hypothetical protein